MTYTYFRKRKSRVEIKPEDLLNQGLVFNLYFSMNNDLVYEERSIYTFWDMLGDVGGLFGSLTFLGGIYLKIIEFVLGSRMN